MAPPIDVPCPPMYFVSEWTTMSAPKAIGFISTGVGTVLSTMTATPCLCAIVVIASRSGMLPAGLPIVSQYTATVFASISFSSSAALSFFAKRTSMPWRGSVCAKRLKVPP